MKLFGKKDISFIAVATSLSLFSVWYACSGGTGMRTHTLRELATVINISELTPTESLRFENISNTQVSPCGDDVTLAESLFNPRHCPLAPLAGKFVVGQLKEDYNEEEISAAYLKRYAKVKGSDIPVDGSPRIGAETPIATFVVFTDFQCPYCKKAAEKLDALHRQYPKETALIFKNFPITSLHPQSEMAARAAFAAGRQEKFWEMHDVLFSASGSEITRERIGEMAEGLGLDLEKFNEDFESTAATAAIDADKKLGEQLGVKGTPTLFINGRLITAGYRGVEERLKEEMLRAGVK